MKIAIAFATMTGNTLECATEIQTYLKSKQIDSTLFDLFKAKAEELKGFDLVFIGSSTYDDGGLNIIAKQFFDSIEETFDFNKEKFAIFALGDSWYPDFATSGEAKKDKLIKLNATVLTPIHIIDGMITDDIKSKIIEWVNNILKQAQ